MVGAYASVTSIKVDMPNAPAPVEETVVTDSTGKPTKLRWIKEGYFDAGYEKLIGVFSTQILRYGIRYGQDDLHVYVRNETLDTRGTGLPYPQAVQGSSVGLEYRHWFPGNQMFACISIGDGVGGLNQGKTDVRYGLVGYTNWVHNSWFSDFYGELFYIALAGDTFLDARLRSGRIWHKDKQGYVWGYVVGQFWASGQDETGTENRMEAGLGIGYVFKNAISLNFELRGGYSYRGETNEKTYFNPTIILSGGFYN